MRPNPSVVPVTQEVESLEALLLVPVATVVVDETEAILGANDLFSEMLGWDPEELVGRTLATLIPERLHTKHAEHFARYLQAQATRPLNSGHDFWALHRDGRELPLDIAVRPLVWQGRRVIVASVRDLSRQRETEDKLRESETRFRIAANHTADMVQEVNLQDDRMIYHGDIDHHFGYEAGEFPRTVSGFVDLIHPEDQADVEADVERASSSGIETWNWQYRLRAGDGMYRHIVDQGTFIRFQEDGRPTQGVGAFQDITEQKLREQELRSALAELQTARDRLAEENIYLRKEIHGGPAHGDIVGDSELWRHLLSQILLVAGTDATVLLTGETGTGKELLARMLHSDSERSDRALIKVNCAALPSTLIESELFGHERGAFSGADRRRKGRFELADGGTLLLDEIGELPLELQAKLLHVLQTGEFERLGSSDTRRSDVRVIAATNRDLGQEVEAGRFRSDLYYRLAVFPIEVPPLRRRRGDIQLLALYFLEKYNGKLGKSIETIRRRAMTALEEYDWPGNVRELENLIERAAILSHGDTLQIDTAQLVDRSSVETSRRGSQTAAATVRSPSASLEEVERAHVLEVLEACAWKVKGRGNAAERLGLKESTLRSRMKRLGISRP